MALSVAPCFASGSMRIRRREEKVRVVAFSPSDGTVASASDDRTGTALGRGDGRRSADTHINLTFHASLSYADIVLSSTYSTQLTFPKLASEQAFILLILHLANYSLNIIQLLSSYYRLSCSFRPLFSRYSPTSKTGH